MTQELLFNKYNIFSAVDAQKEAVKKGVQLIAPNTVLNASEHDLVQALVEEFRLNVPVIKDEDIYIAHSGETQVDVSRDPTRVFYDRSEPLYITGNETVIAVPFEGDAEFFRIQPRTYTLNPPRAEIGNGEILLTYVKTDQNAEAIKQEYQRTVSSIKEYLRSLSESATQFNKELEGLAASQLKARKDRLLADAGTTAAIGPPMKKREGANTETKIQLLAQKQSDTPEKPKRSSIPMLPTQTRAVFISYAHADNQSSDPKKRWLDRFVEFLQPLVSQENFTLSSDQDIRIGEQWHERIQAHLNSAKAVVLLVSPAFLASSYVRNSELPVILKNAADKEGVKILPILISPSLFNLAKYKYPDPKTGPQEFTIASLQAANAPSKTLVEMNEGEQNRVLLEVAEQLADLLSANPQ